MRELPILFSSEMVRAILDDRKTQTRRVVKPQPILMSDYHNWKWVNKKLDAGYCHTEEYAMKIVMLEVAKYQVGDKLWVKETFWYCCDGCKKAFYKADNPNLLNRKTTMIGGQIFKVVNNKWKSSRFMPKSMARIWLEVTDVRVERLQDISGDDIRKEGINKVKNWANPLKGFIELWDSINGKKYPWKDNPWVWAIEFKRIKQ